MTRYCSRPRCWNHVRPAIVAVRPHRYCADHHAGAQRRFRQTHVPTEAEKLKKRARAYAQTYVRRGKIERKPCRGCGSKKSEMHHEDYSKPLDVDWLCRRCHMTLHYQAATLTDHHRKAKNVDNSPTSGLSR